MERTKQHLLQKLYSREVCGSFSRGRTGVSNRADKLFKNIPERLMFCLKDILPNIGNHVLLGTSRCGQFLITYSFTTNINLPVHLCYRFKYRLHWWAFRPNAPAHKVAEVQLFDNQDIKYALTLGMAQWPNVNDKLVVYGYNDDSDGLDWQEDGDMETRQYYITVTTLPSLHNCKDCQNVAESFDEEEMAANWDSCIVLSCLKHGLTIHTTLEISPPYPMMDFLTSLKIDNNIIVNTGNFLHVLTFNSNEEEIKPSEDDNIVPAEISHRIGEKITSVAKEYLCPWSTQSKTVGSRRMFTRSVNNAWLNTIMDQAEKVYAFEETEDGCEPRFKWYKKRRIADKMYEFCSDDEDMENVCPPSKVPRYLGPKKYYPLRDPSFEVKYVKKDHRDDDGWKSPNSNKTVREHERKENFILSENPKYFVESIRNKQMEIGLRKKQEGMHNKGNVPSSSCDIDISNVNNINNTCDIQRLEGTSPQLNEQVIASQQNLVDNVSNVSKDCDNKLNTITEPQNCQESLPSCASCHSSGPDQYNIPPLDMSIINPDLSALLADWDHESISSLSPKSETFVCKNRETKNEVIQSFLGRIPGMPISPRGSNGSQRSSGQDQSNEGSEVGSRSGDSPKSPNSSTGSKYSPLLVVLRARNCNQNKESLKAKESDEKGMAVTKEEGVTRVNSKKDTDPAMRQRMISGCSVQFDRIYIEVDEEIMSTITDVEDDDQGTGFHCALPLSVHGSAYSELQMVSSQKAERLNIHCERVYQKSLDIEQFCFKAADIICQSEGFKFWYCHDYDVEIIDVCALNGDILGVVCLRLNAEKKPPKTERHSVLNQRYFYEVRSVFIWNPKSDLCWLEAYSELVDVTKYLLSTTKTHWAPARHEAVRLRTALDKKTLFSLQAFPPIRSLSHRMWSNETSLSPSVEEMRDHTNLIGFRLVRASRQIIRSIAVFL